MFTLELDDEEVADLRQSCEAVRDLQMQRGPHYDTEMFDLMERRYFAALRVVNRMEVLVHADTLRPA